MAQLQIRSDDTIIWTDGYGNKSYGSTTISSPITPGTAMSAFTGTATDYTGTVPSTSGFAVGDIVTQYQTRNGGTAAGAWQMNKITAISGTTFTFKYPLTNTYGTTGQIAFVPQYDTLTLSSTINVVDWNQIRGGILVLMGRRLINNGTIDFSGLDGNKIETDGNANSLAGGGFRGGIGNDATSGSSNVDSYHGEGTAAAATLSPNTSPTSPSGNAGGAASFNNSGISRTGGGGGNGTAGANGTLGTGGAISGNSDLTIMTFGGGGGGGGNGGNVADGVASGANGGGACVLIFEYIEGTGIINGRGGISAVPTRDNNSTGGAGAGGSLLLKGQNIDLSSMTIQLNGGTSADCANGGEGRFHADYGSTYSGPSSIDISSSVTTTKDSFLASNSNTMFLAM